MRLKPSQIYYSQDSINFYWGKHSIHNNLADTLKQLYKGGLRIDDIPEITVHKMDDGCWVTSDNRRLWVFEKLESYGKCTTIPVKTSTDPVPANKYSTKNGGVSIEVRNIDLKSFDPGWSIVTEINRPARVINKPVIPDETTLTLTMSSDVRPVQDQGTAEVSIDSSVEPQKDEYVVQLEPGVKDTSTSEELQSSLSRVPTCPTDESLDDVNTEKNAEVSVYDEHQKQNIDMDDGSIEARDSRVDSDGGADIDAESEMCVSAAETKEAENCLAEMYENYVDQEMDQSARSDIISPQQTVDTDVEMKNLGKVREPKDQLQGHLGYRKEYNEENLGENKMCQDELREERLGEKGKRLGKKEKRLGELEKRQEDVEKRLGEKEKRLIEMEVRLGEKEKRLKKEEERLEKEEERLEQKEERLEQEEERLEQAEEHLGEKEKRLGEMEKRLGEIEKRLREEERRQGEEENRQCEAEEILRKNLVNSSAGQFKAHTMRRHEYRQTIAPYSKNNNRVQPLLEENKYVMETVNNTINEGK